MRNMKFDPSSPGLNTTIDTPLQVVKIYFDTATFDEIKRDVKVTINAQLGLIGGTMGLLTGFSILSAFEIIYFLCRILMTLKQSNVGPQVILVREERKT